MGYDVHITRKQHDWSDEADPAAISLEEWKAYVAADPEMRLDDSASGNALWLSYFRKERVGCAFWHEGDGIHVKNPDEEILGKMLAVAHALQARVQGDDGEYYDEVDPVFGLRPEENSLAWETSDFRDFQSFGSPEAAQPLLDALGQQGIDYRTALDTGQMAFDPSFANNQLSRKFIVKLRQADFERGSVALAALHEHALRQVSPDHYLFKFTDQELFDILAKPDEWSGLDVALASQLLRQRGRDISPDTLKLLRQHRAAELAQPDYGHSSWVSRGYLLALLGGVAGILIGYQLYASRKQVPDGRRVATYSPTDRVHGLRILVLGIFMFLLLLTLRFVRSAG